MGVQVINLARNVIVGGLYTTTASVTGIVDYVKCNEGDILQLPLNLIGNS